MIIRITSKRFCAGLIVYNWPDTKNTCAPIIRYMESWDRGRIMAYCEIKGWGYEEIIEKIEIDNKYYGQLF